MLVMFGRRVDPGVLGHRPHGGGGDLHVQLELGTRDRGSAVAEAYRQDLCRVSAVRAAVPACAVVVACGVAVADAAETGDAPPGLRDQRGGGFGRVAGEPGIAADIRVAGWTGCRIDCWFEARCARLRAWRPGPESNRLPDVLRTSSRPSGSGSGPCVRRGVRGWHGCALVVRALGGSRTLIPVAGSSSSDWSVYLLRHERVTARCCGACPRRELNSHWRRPERRASAGRATRAGTAALAYVGNAKAARFRGLLPAGGSMIRRRCATLRPLAPRGGG